MLRDNLESPGMQLVVFTPLFTGQEVRTRGRHMRVWAWTSLLHKHLDNKSAIRIEWERTGLQKKDQKTDIKKKKSGPLIARVTSAFTPLTFILSFAFSAPTFTGTYTE